MAQFIVILCTPVYSPCVSLIYQSEGVDYMSRSDMNAAAAAALIERNRSASKSASEAVKSRSTMKGQRNAVAKAEETPDVVKSVDLTWQPPAPFRSWVKRNHDVVFLTTDEATEAGRSDLVAEYQLYVDGKFNAPITFGDTGSFEKILRKQIRLERQGAANLGLLGYSADDIAQLAVANAWAHRIKQYMLEQDDSMHNPVDEESGKRSTCLCLACEIDRALRDDRSDEELRRDAEPHGQVRYTSDGVHIEARDPLSAASKAARFLAAREQFRTLPLVMSGDAKLLLPTVGQTYREVKKVIAEGLRKFRNSLEGLTFDGVISDATQFIAEHRADLVDAGYDKMVARLDRSLAKDMYDYTMFDEADMARVERRAVYNVLADKDDKVPAESDAMSFIQLLMAGYDLATIQAAFGFETVAPLNRIASDAEQIASEIKATDEYIIARRHAIEELLTEEATLVSSAL